MPHRMPQVRTSPIGEKILNDPDASAVLSAIQRINAREACFQIVQMQADRVGYFKNRIVQRNLSPGAAAIVILNVNDPHGGPLTEILMPGQDAVWQTMRSEGQVPYARGLVPTGQSEGSIQDLITAIDPTEGQRFSDLSKSGKTAVVIMDYGVVAVFEA